MLQRFTAHTCSIVSLLSFLGCGSAHSAEQSEPPAAPAERATAAPSREQGSADSGAAIPSTETSADLAADELNESARDAGVAVTSAAGAVATSAAGAVAQPMAADTTPVEVQLRCAGAVLDVLPAGIELIASDVSEHLWTASAGVVSWFTASDASGPTLWRKSAAGAAAGMPLAATVRLPDQIVQSDAIAASGGEVFLRQLQSLGVNGVAVVLQRLSDGAAPFNLAHESGTSLGQIVVDDTAVYWLKLDREQLSFERTERAARSTQDTQTLGSQAVPGWDDSGSLAHVAGPVALGDRVFAARSLRGKGRVLQVSKTGHEPLSLLGPALPAVSAMTGDGEGLVLALEPELDDLGNVHTPARIVRLTFAGKLQEIARIAAAGPSFSGYGAQSVVVRGGRAYWNDNEQIPDWRGSLWSVPLDGSSAPIKELSTLGNLLSQELATDADGVIFAPYCRVDLPDGQVTGRTHLVRLRR